MEAGAARRGKVGTRQQLLTTVTQHDFSLQNTVARQTFFHKTNKCLFGVSVDFREKTRRRAVAPSRRRRAVATAASARWGARNAQVRLGLINSYL
jgi:hypothetical protein